MVVMKEVTEQGNHPLVEYESRGENFSSMIAMNLVELEGKYAGE
jgi:hypothetical protein